MLTVSGLCAPCLLPGLLLLTHLRCTTACIASKKHPHCLLMLTNATSSQASEHPLRFSPAPGHSTTAACFCADTSNFALAVRGLGYAFQANYITRCASPEGQGGYWGAWLAITNAGFGVAIIAQCLILAAW